MKERYVQTLRRHITALRSIAIELATRKGNKQQRGSVTTRIIIRVAIASLWVACAVSNQVDFARRALGGKLGRVRSGR
jgi:hypothetical protein